MSFVFRYNVIWVRILEHGIIPFLIKLFTFNCFWQHRQAKKSRIWVPIFLRPKAVICHFWTLKVSQWITCKLTKVTRRVKTFYTTCRSGFQYFFFFAKLSCTAWSFGNMEFLHSRLSLKISKTKILNKQANLHGSIITWNNNNELVTQTIKCRKVLARISY